MASMKTLEQLLVKELKRELRERGLTLGGNRDALATRLRQALLDEDEDPDTYLFELKPDVVELMIAMQVQMNSGQKNIKEKDKMDSGIKTELLTMNQRIQGMEETINQRINTIDEQMKQRVDAVEKAIE
ncbi:scaffold attachment factor B2-like [Biomphalaria glabrata]|uniref:Scaffold attachment factor B2-like n=1 Tax=Biomphalaria glabrata TaxID=6526 RepID=A0A9W2YJ88_BIOGL|nr:scaffold attachment factor B2-like [Biomphalaria glabrata]